MNEIIHNMFEICIPLDDVSELEQFSMYNYRDQYNPAYAESVDWETAATT